MGPRLSEVEVSAEKEKAQVYIYIFYEDIFPDRSMGTFLRQKTDKAFVKVGQRVFRDRSIPSPAHLADTNTFWPKPFSLQANVFQPASRVSPVGTRHVNGLKKLNNKLVDKSNSFS